MNNLFKTTKGRLLLRHLVRCRKCFKDAKAQELQTVSKLEELIASNHPGDTV